MVPDARPTAAELIVIDGSRLVLSRMEETIVSSIEATWLRRMVRPSL